MAMSVATNPHGRPTAASFAFARSLKSGCKGVSCVLMTCQPRPSLAGREPWFRGIPPDDGRQDREDRRFAADDSPSVFLRACWQSMWLTLRHHRHNILRLVVVPPLQSIGDDRATN